jgi:hypothetical protein
VVRVGARVLNLLLIGQNKIFSNQLALKNADIVDEFIPAILARDRGPLISSPVRSASSQLNTVLNI